MAKRGRVLPGRRDGPVSIVGDRERKIKKARVAAGKA